MDIKLYILWKIVHSTENCTFYLNYTFFEYFIFNQILNIYQNCKFIQKLNFLLKIVHLTKNCAFNQKLDI